MSPMKFGDTFVSFELVILKNGISHKVTSIYCLFVCFVNYLSMLVKVSEPLDKCSKELGILRRV